MNNDLQLLHKEITDKIPHAFYQGFFPQLGHWFLEKVYDNGMVNAFVDLGVKVHQQARIDLYFHESLVGQYFADLLIEDAVIVELKSVPHLLKEHKAQLLSYLRPTPYEVGLLINFGPKPVFRRMVL